jgi:serine/threonine protein kinase
VKETSVIKRQRDEFGNKTINEYSIIRELGRGFHGKVKLVKDSAGKEWALKVINKTPRRRLQSKLSKSYKLKNQLIKIKTEIAILKKCSHPHIVKLKEVVDCPNSDKIYFILEYMPGGELKWKHPNSNWPDSRKFSFNKASISMYTENECRKIFRDILAGVQYLHFQGIVHRDIKPANMLWSAERRIKISDFSVSVFVGTDNTDQKLITSASDIELARTAGSPAFFPPELCGIDSKFKSNLFSAKLDFSARMSKVDRIMLHPNLKPPLKGAALDIWAIGVSLYCLVFGRVPFVGFSEFELLRVIATKDLEFPSHIPISLELKELLTRMLEKDPLLRISMEEIKVC